MIPITGCALRCIISGTIQHTTLRVLVSIIAVGRTCSARLGVFIRAIATNANSRVADGYLINVRVH